MMELYRGGITPEKANAFLWLKHPFLEALKICKFIGILIMYYMSPDLFIKTCVIINNMCSEIKYGPHMFLFEHMFHKNLSGQMNI